MKWSVLLVAFVMGCVSEPVATPSPSEAAPDVSTVSEPLESPSYFKCTDAQVCIGLLTCEDQGGILGGACGPGGKVCCSW